MKKVFFIFIAILAFSLTSHADPGLREGSEPELPQVTTCGSIDPNAIKGEFASLLVPGKEGFYEEKFKFTAISQQAKSFLNYASFLGGRVCDPSMEFPADMLFHVCISGPDATRAAEISCGEIRKPCEGPFCGGNGFSVNSGSIN